VDAARSTTRPGGSSKPDDVLRQVLIVTVHD
jgi:hypothetical protein